MSTKYIKKIENGAYISTAVEPVYGKGHSRTSAVNPDVYVDGKWMDSINGTDKVVNGTFDTALGAEWVVGANTGTGIQSIENGMLKVEQTTGDYAVSLQIVELVIGRAYRASISGLGIYAKFRLGSEIGQSEYANNISVNGVTVEIDFIADFEQLYIRLKNDTGVDNTTSYFDNISVFETAIEPNAILPAQTYLPLELEVDASGNPVLITDTKKVEVVAEKIVAEEVACDNFTGKNACTAWVNFDGTTTPPTIRDSFNVSDVVRISTGAFEVYFNSNMDNIAYSISGVAGTYITERTIFNSNVRGLDKVQVTTEYDNIATETTNTSMQVYGGKS